MLIRYDDKKEVYCKFTDSTNSYFYHTKKKYNINYESLCNPLINQDKYGYELHSSSGGGGGIDFGYMKLLPLYQLLQSFSMHTLQYHDLVGHTIYCNSSEIDLTELTIFEEILKKEGAIIKVE